MLRSALNITLKPSRYTAFAHLVHQRCACNAEPGRSAIPAAHNPIALFERL